MELKICKSEIVSLKAPPLDKKHLFQFDSRRSCWVAEGFRKRELFGKVAIPSVEQVRRFFDADALSPCPMKKHQTAAIDCWINSDGYGLVELPTGAGKTHLALKAISLFKCSTIIVVPTRILLRQWHSLLSKNQGVSVGIWGDSEYRSGEIVVATFASALTKLKEYNQHFCLLIMDEVHHLLDGKFSLIPRMCTAEFRLGLSATLQNKLSATPQTVLGAFGNLVYSCLPKDLPPSTLSHFRLRTHFVNPPQHIKAEILELRPKLRSLVQHIANNSGCPQPKWNQIVAGARHLKFGSAILAQWKFINQDIHVCEAVLTKISSIVKAETSDTEFASTIIFAPNFFCATTIACYLKCPAILSGIGAKERERWLSLFADKKVKALVTCRVLNEGYDLPKVNQCIIVGNTKFGEEYLQRLGRILRFKANKICTVHEIKIKVLTSTVQLEEKKLLLESTFGNLYEN